MNGKMRLVFALVAVTVVLSAFGTVLIIASPGALAAPAAATSELAAETVSIALLAAALSTALAALGAGYAVAKLGAAAVGALAEKPELFGRLLILVGLAEGIAIYGLIVSVLILNRLG
jgi:V/A-type H+-transporting ATPase subunit K